MKNQHTKVNQSSEINEYYNLIQYPVHNSHNLKFMTTNNIILKCSLIYKSLYVITVFNSHGILSAYFLIMLNGNYQKKLIFQFCTIKWKTKQNPNKFVL